MPAAVRTDHVRTDHVRPDTRRNGIEAVLDALARKAPRDSHLHNTHVLLLKGRAPTLALVRDHVRTRAPNVPALGCVARGGRWTTSSAFEAADHVHELVLDDRTGGHDLLASALLDGDLPVHAPRWGLWLVHGYADDEYALCYRSHHGFQDASASQSCIRGLFGAPAPDNDAPPMRPRLSPKAAARVTRDLAHAFLPTGRPPRLPAGGDGARAIARARVDLTRLHAVACAAGVSINDVHLALSAAAVHAWIRWANPDRRTLYACVPLDTRLRGKTETGVGNKLGMIRVPLHDGEEVTAESLTATATSAADTRAPEYRATARRMLELVPGPVGRWATHHLLRPAHTAMINSRVAYPRGLSFADTPVHDAFVVPSLFPGHLCFITLSSHGSNAHVAFVTDARRPALDRTIRHWQACLDALEAELGLRTPESPPAPHPHPTRPAPATTARPTPHGSDAQTSTATAHHPRAADPR
ncbi:wax ester/triacylglycerol synthase domain-containing protein [Embleya sp. AB8]|uniref:wax ester/triacylglycerol synthase domain-containing protein n=1 Tax=Embleya sp. AB8 TaxID=3156304 RepID=UPI003C759E5D